MVSWAEALYGDIRYAGRTLRRSPGFAAVAVLTLAVGIGASTAVFSVVDLLLFRSLPYPRADRLVSLGFSGPIDTDEFNVGNAYLDWRARQTTFESLTSMVPGGQCDLTGPTPVRINCQAVESNFLRTLGIVPLLGRDFRPEDDRPGVPKVALLGYSFWRSRFGGDPHAIGKAIDLDGNLVRIAGILPASFEMPQLGPADVLLPEQMDERAARAPNATVFLRTFGRLKDGIDIDGARQRMLPLFEESVKKDVPANLRKEVHLVVRSLRDRQIHGARLASWLLFGAVLALLALACANVANLLLARAASRRGELAMRAALGASRGRLMRQMLAEGLVLSIAGGAAACLFAALLLRTFVAISPEGLLRLIQARLVEPQQTLRRDGDKRPQQQRGEKAGRGAAGEAQQPGFPPASGASAGRGWRPRRRASPIRHGARRRAPAAGWPRWHRPAPAAPEPRRTAATKPAGHRGSAGRATRAPPGVLPCAGLRGTSFCTLSSYSGSIRWRAASRSMPSFSRPKVRRKTVALGARAARSSICSGSSTSAGPNCGISKWRGECRRSAPGCRRGRSSFPTAWGSPPNRDRQKP